MNWSKISKAAIVVSAAIFAAYYFFRPIDGPWEPALAAIGRDRLIEVVRDNSKGLELEPDFPKIQGMIRLKYVQPFLAPRLVIVDFNTQKMCGIIGCLYSIYLVDQPKRPLFRWFLHSSLPPKVKLFSVEGSCFLVFQSHNGQLVRIRYCKSGNTYAESNREYLDLISITQ